MDTKYTYSWFSQNCIILGLEGWFCCFFCFFGSHASNSNLFLLHPCFCVCVWASQYLVSVWLELENVWWLIEKQFRTLIFYYVECFPGVFTKTRFDCLTSCCQCWILSDFKVLKNDDFSCFIINSIYFVSPDKRTLLEYWKWVDWLCSGSLCSRHLNKFLSVLWLSWLHLRSLNV